MPISFKLASSGPVAAMTGPRHPRPAALLAVLLVGASVLSPAMAATTARTAGPAAAVVDNGPATTAERAALGKRFVSKWGGYAERVYGVELHGWSRRMAPTFAHGDANNLRDALRRDTFEGAMAALGGAGHRVDDDLVIDVLATAAPTMAAGKIPDMGMALGALGEDLVYTPIQPCRIVDTRIVEGAIGASQTRSYRAAGIASYTSQGGSTGNCGLQGEVPSAVALNVAAVSPMQPGYATVFPHGTVQPQTASVNYAAGTIVNNAIISRIPNPTAASDFSIYTFAESHYVVDIVGYFAPPRATALSCVDSFLASTVIGAGSNGQVTAPACASGYTATQLDCESGSWFMPIVFSSLRGGGICGARNNGSTSATLVAARRCCRVPGR